MPVSLGPKFETAVLTLAGVDPATIDPGSLDITMLNPSGPSTVRCMLVLSVDTDELKQAIRDTIGG